MISTCRLAARLAIAFGAAATLAACRQSTAAPPVEPAMGATADAGGGRMPAGPSATVPPTSTPDPFAARGAPARLEIPAIEVAVDLERLRPDGEDRIAAPKAWENAGWYEAGFFPGEPGSAIVTGHLDTDRGTPAVFWRLKDVKRGDRVSVVYANGDRFDFEVEDKKLVDADTVAGDVYARLFDDGDEPRLSLITCDGAWDAGRATYAKRLIIFTRLVAGPATTPAPPG